VAPPAALMTARPADPSSRARQHDPDHAAVERSRGRAEQDVDGRPVPVLPRSDRQPDLAVLDRKMMVGRRDQDRALTQWLAVARRPAGHLPGATEDVREHAGASGGYVEHDADRGRKVGGQVLDHARENLDSTSRRPDHHQIAPAVRMRVDRLPFHRRQRTLRRTRVPPSVPQPGPSPPRQRLLTLPIAQGAPDRARERERVDAIQLGHLLGGVLGSR
jgi:hypothetical protein